jgi:hypothetical protein
MPWENYSRVPEHNPADQGVSDREKSITGGVPWKIRGFGPPDFPAAGWCSAKPRKPAESAISFGFSGLCRIVFTGWFFEFLLEY